MGDLTRNFSAHEFACPCNRCGSVGKEMDPDFILALQKVRDDFGIKMKPESGFRCPSHNELVGGVEHSRHLYGDAADFSYPDKHIRARLVYLALKEGLSVGVNKRNMVHVDGRGGKNIIFGY